MFNFHTDHEAQASGLADTLLKHNEHALHAISQNFETTLSEAQQRVNLVAFTCCLVEHTLEGRARADQTRLLSDYLDRLQQGNPEAEGDSLSVQLARNQMDSFLKTFPAIDRGAMPKEKADFLSLVQMTFCLLFFFKLPTEQSAVDKLLPEVLATRALIDCEAEKQYAKKGL